METLAAVLLGFFTVGCLVLAGAGLGVGMLLPALARGERERRLTLAAVRAPFVRGGGPWLLGAVAVLLGWLPGLAEELFGGRYGGPGGYGGYGRSAVPVLLALGWAVRRAGLRRPGARRAAALVTGGSWLLALAWSWLLATLLLGAGSGTGSAMGSGSTGGPTAAGPTAATVLAVAALFALHGLAFAALRLTGRPFERARLLAGLRGGGQSFALTSVALAALPPAIAVRLPLRDAAADGPLPWLLAPVLLAAAPLLVAAQLRTWRTFRERAGGGGFW